MDWPDYIDLSEEVQHAFKIDSYPTFILLDKDGVIRFRQSGVGQTTAGELSDAINKALKHESDPKLAAAAAAEASSETVAAPAASTGAASASSSSASAARSSNEGAKADLHSPAKSTDIEGGAVSGNTYKNVALGMTFQLPQGLVPASSETLRTLNSQREDAAKAAILRQHPELANSQNISIPKTVFYASRKGQWDGQQMEIPSVRISAVPSHLDAVSLDSFQQMADNMSAASGTKLTGSPVEFRVKKHPFVRADFDRGVGAVHMHQSMVQTIAGDFLLTVEIYAYSSDELQQVAAFLQTMTISDDEN